MPLKMIKYSFPQESVLVPGCNTVDVGAHGGDTAIPLAVASRGGTVVAIEMGLFYNVCLNFCTTFPTGPPMEILKLNVRLNPSLNILVHR